MFLFHLWKPAGVGGGQDMSVKEGSPLHMHEVYAQNIENHWGLKPLPLEKPTNISLT